MQIYILKDIKVQLVSTALANRRYESRLGTESKRAYYDAAEKTIYINVDGNYANGNASSVIMHEILHAITVDKILSNPDRKQSFIDIMNQYNAYVNNLDRRYIKSPIESKDQTVEEFVANIWSDPKTIEILKEIKVDDSNLTLWDKIKQFFTDLFADIFEGTTEDSLMAKASEEMIRLLESPTTTESTEKFNESIKDNNTKFTTSKASSYAKRTRDNANWSDITLALATDFNTAGEKLTKTAAGDKYVSSNINDSVDKIVSSILKQINRKGLPVKNIKLNVAGNGIYSLKNFSQEKVNNLVTEVIKGLQKAGITISEIRSGGQTGVDEAGIIAAQRLNIPNSVHTTSDWKFRDSSGKDISDETAFKERFNQSSKDQRRKTYTGMITSLKDNQVFVFGSNPEGRHGAGAAKTAKDKFGAKYGQGEGIQGQSYALPTKRIKKISTSYSGQMAFSYGENKRTDIESSSTFEAIINGERTATTRYVSDGNIDYWKNLKVGDIVAFTSKDKKGIAYVRITKPLTKLFKNTNVEVWSKKEGWSTEYYESKVKPKVLAGEAFQMEYEFVDANGERTVTPKEIRENIKRMYEAARNNPDKEFIVAYSKDGKNLNGYTSEDMAEMFASEDIPSNIVFEEGFNELVNKYETNTSKSNIDIKVLDQSKAIIEEIIADSEENIKKHKNFDKEDIEGSHTYLIKIDGKWVPADYSVTQLISGNIDLGDWKLPSTKIGNTTDKFVRDYFQLEPSKRKNIVRRSYPNLTMEHKKDFFDQMQKLEAYFDSIYGKGHYRVETREFPIPGRYYYDEDGTTKYYNIAGTMDMIVYDDKGNIDIYDVKTVRSGIDKSKQEKYTKQLSIYKAILEANYPELRGKIRNLSLIRFDVKYPKPSDVLYTTIDPDKDTLYISEDSDLEFKELKYYDSDIYDSPKLKSDYIIPLSPYSYEDEIKSLTEEERALVEEEMEKEEKETFETPKNNLYNNPLLTASESRFLADNVMNYVSFIVSNLQSDSESNSYYFDSKYSQYDFTSMSRNEILNISGVLSDIFYYIKEAYYNPDNRDDIEDFDILDKLQVAYDNWEELVKSGYSRLITLEGVTVYDVLPEDIKTELTDVDNDYNLDAANLEEKEREYWQIGIRNISAKASLSKDIRRLFEKLEVIDSGGESVLDSFGFGFKTFVNSDEAVNSILSWCSECTNMEEMEKMLQTYEENNPWLTPILEKIKEEPIRSQFFQNFRKDFTQYSIVLTETDGKGNTVYKTLIINTKGASKVMLEGVTNAYTLGLLTDIIKPIKGDIEGRGSVNATKVKTLSDSISDIDSKLSEAFKNRTITRTINSVVKELASILNSLGVQVDSKTLKDAFALDKNKKNYNASNIYTIINNLKYLTDTLLEAKNEATYNPIIKGEKYNVYGNYKNIINTLSKYIQDSIESSSYENGKMHYSFVTPSYMGKLVTNLKNAISDTNKFEKFIEDEYKSYKWFYSEGKWLNDWLKQLATQSSARQDFDHKVQLAFDDVPYTELSELNYALSLIHEYFYDKNGKLAWYRVPILANKPSSEFIRFRRYTGKNYQKDIKRKLGNVLTQEISRIKTVLERSYNPNVNKIGVKEKITYDIVDSMLLNSKGKLDTNLIKRIKKGELTIKDFIVNGKLRFENSGASFKFLPALNNEFLNETELAQLIVDKINGKEVNEERLTKLFNDAIDAYMAMIVSKELNYYESLGMFDIEKKKDKSFFKYLNQLGNSIEEIKGNLTEYIWNDMFATINIIQLTATDLAYYKNVEEFQKRYSQVHAPTLKFNTTAVDSKGVKYSADAKARTIYIKDSIVVSEIIPNVTKIFEDKIKTLSGAEKEHMKMMKDLIISSFEDINVADAQAYSSPTSYRKKMGMQGKWTAEMEKAYERIKSGNYNVNDLGVVWQPLKPFVYSQIRKSSGASTMSEIKVPVQNKNSEYLLILADALMRSGNQVSKLTAIFDFMEESAYDGRIHKDGKVISEGVYNGKGIDTVQFESAVNSGSMGAIDINELSSYEDIKQALHEAVYYNSDKSESSDNNDDRYNDQYVHTISFEDYGIQQEVPAHFIDHEQLMGSQIRILSISDITPGTKFTIKGESIEDRQLIQEYQELHAQNIRESFKDLVDEFNIKGTKLQKNKALERILQDAILKDQRYGADLLRACTLNEQGEFTIPLYDPIQSIRIQQLINSIIKSRINKQKISGGPVVQTSVFGMSDDLKIVWEDKDKGIVKHFECYMPIPSKELEELMTRYDSNGNAYFISLDEAVKQGIVPEEMRKAIGYRIPTEDKYSMVPLYIKGFLPKAAGESIMLPKEITKLSGSDFDIKLFIGVIKLC